MPGATARLLRPWIPVADTGSLQPGTQENVPPLSGLTATPRATPGAGSASATTTVPPGSHTTSVTGGVLDPAGGAGAPYASWSIDVSFVHWYSSCPAGAGSPTCVRVPRKSPPLVAASTLSRWSPLDPAVAPGSRTSRKTPAPSSTPMPASGSHGLAPTRAFAGAIAARMPSPPKLVSPMGDSLGMSSPVPTRTTSPAAVPPKSTSSAPQDWALLAPPERASRSAQPPTGSQLVPPSAEYQTPPMALAAYTRRPSPETAMSRMRPLTLGRPPPCPRRTTAGPIGTQRRTSPVGNAFCRARPRPRPLVGGGSATLAEASWTAARSKSPARATTWRCRPSARSRFAARLMTCRPVLRGRRRRPARAG